MNKETLPDRDKALKSYIAEVKKVTDILDETTKQRDSLLKACERFRKITIEGYGNIHWINNYDFLEQAIKEAKNE